MSMHRCKHAIVCQLLEIIASGNGSVFLTSRLSWKNYGYYLHLLLANRLVTTPYGNGSYLQASKRYTVSEKGQAYLSKARELDDFIEWHGMGLIPKHLIPG